MLGKDRKSNRSHNQFRLVSGNWRVTFTRAAVSADMALRLAAALGGSAESWLRMQAAYDLWQAAKKRRPKVAPLGLAA